MRKTPIPKLSPTEIITAYYDKFGWQSAGDLSGEDKTFRGFPPAYALYEPTYTQRIEGAFAERTGTIAFVGCGDMPESHMRIAARFDTIICCDISAAALVLCQQKLGDRASYVLGSIVETILPDALADVIFCSHALYHIDRAKQEQAVRQMLRLTKPGGRVVILYANPMSPLTLPAEIRRGLMRLIGRRADTGGAGGEPEIYYHAYPLSWWNRFKGACRITFEPGGVIAARPARRILRTNGMAVAFFRGAKRIEEKHPDLAARLWQFPMVILENPAA